MKKSIFLAALIIAVFTFIACNKTEQYKTDTIGDFAPLVIGKYIIYQLDSAIFANNIQKTDTVISYQVKQLVQDAVTDNLGRKGFSIRRFIRVKPTDEWVADNTFFAINTGTSYEFIENNLRYLKLIEPIKNGYTWKGNTYIDTYSNMDNDLTYLDSWVYKYDSLNTPLVLGTLKVDSTLKVFERDEVLGNVSNAAVYSEVNFSVSNYGRGIGLIYHRFLHQEYQPATPNSTAYKLGYGVTLTMLDHN